MNIIEKVLTRINKISLFGLTIDLANSTSTESQGVAWEIGDYTTKVEGPYAAKIPLSIKNYGDKVAFNVHFLAYIHFPEGIERNDIVLNHMHCQLQKMNPNESIFIGDVYIPYNISTELALSFMESDDNKRPVLKTFITSTDSKQKDGMIKKQTHCIQHNHIDEIENGQTISYSIFHFFSDETIYKVAKFQAVKDENKMMKKKHNELSYIPKVEFRKNL